jgi:HD-GYP domain-containing protein (c-di-GMP phosphodiesterase class II)
VQETRCYRALKLSEIHSDTTHFDLYVEKNGELVPYTSGQHKWSKREKDELRQSRQFVLFYLDHSDGEVNEYLAGKKSGAIEPNLDLLIHDGIAEFIKTRALFPATDEQRTFFQGLGIGLSRYFAQQQRLARMLESLALHDSYSFYQGMRTAALAVAISQESGKAARIWDLMLGSVLHDIGNLTIEPGLLNRAGPLSDAEWKLIRRHPEDGVQLLQSVPLSPLVRNLVLQHHERADGLGYPHRQRLGQLPREVRLLNFADTYAAVTTPRAYQSAQSGRDAFHFMQNALQAYIDTDFLAPLSRLLRLNQAIPNQTAS